MLDELLVIVSAELILLVSIAAMSLHGRRIDVLSGRYFGNPTVRAVSPDGNIDRLRRWVERERKVQQLRRAKASTSNAGTLRPSATPSQDRMMETISRNRRSPNPITPGSHEVDDRAVRLGQARLVTRATGWG